MKISKLRVEIISKEVENKPFYGKNFNHTIIEKVHYSERDDRPADEFPPCGVHCKFVTMDGETLDIRVDRGYFSELVSAWAYVPFAIDGTAYELNVKFERGKIVIAQLYEWNNYASFEDGYEADMIYQCPFDKKSNLTNEPFVCEEYNN